MEMSGLNVRNEPVQLKNIRLGTQAVETSNITSHQTRIINHAHNQQLRVKGKCHLIELTQTCENVSKDVIEPPHVLCENLRSITSAKHAE